MRSMSSPAPDIRHTFRQQRSVALGWTAVAGCLGMAVATLPRLDLAFVGALLLVAALAFVLLVRPSLQLSLVGVHVNNPLRRSLIPWPLVKECLARWNLQVDAGERVVTAWAIPGHVERPTRPSPYGARSRHAKGGFDVSSGSRPAASARTVARLVEQGRAEWEAEVTGGTLAGDLGGHAVVRSWELLDVALLVAPTCLLVAGVAAGR